MTPPIPCLPWPIQNAADWMPLWQGAGFFLATFVLEDAAAIGAGLLLAAGTISWPVAFASCFLGIWLGDVGLYALARFGGRPWFARSRLGKFSGPIARSEKWFAGRGTWILIFSRCIPGTRLPTYLAAGFLRLPLPRFLLVTGAAALVWTLLILWLAQTVGGQLVHWLNACQHGSWWLLGAGILFLGGLQGLRRSFVNFDLARATARLERWCHWEFWPGWLFYPPVMVYCLWLAIKYRGLTTATVANPGIFSGGLVGESKMTTLADLLATSPEFTAETALIAGDTLGARQQSLARECGRLHLQYPFILKPDQGQRGDGVKLIRNAAQADDYLRQAEYPLIVQRYAPGPCEAGIFYYRFPHEAQGRIFGLVEKIFPVVTGDGRHTVAELIAADPRARLIADRYRRRVAARLEEVLPAGGVVRLVEAGNHAQGCIFRDGARLITPELTARVDEISQQLNGFFIGRYDVRYASEEDFQRGRNFSIVELNGAAAEAANLYDAKHSLWSAYRILFQQWELVFAIGAANKARGCAPTKLAAVWRQRRAYSRISATYPAAD